jgi:hypothetical protein
MTTTNNNYKKDGCHTKQDGTKEWWLKGDIVYTNKINHLHKYDNLNEEFKQSIIKYELTK